MGFRRAFFLVTTSSVFAFLAGGAWTFLFSEDSRDDSYRRLEIFGRVYKIVKQNYVDEPKDEKLIQGAIKGMVENLDPHSDYLNKEEFAEKQADTRGQFGGLGIEIAKKNGMLTVISPIEDTPAFHAGLKSNDVIVKIGEQPTDKLSVFDAVKLMRGKPGSTIEITVRREGVDKLLPFKIKRAVINVKSVTFKMVDGFGVVKLKQFLERSSEEMRKYLKDSKSFKGLVLDLRNNPGGLLQQAVEVSDTFLEKGFIVYTQGRDKVPVDKKFAVEKGTEPSYPMVVLINGGSASASEIVSGALQGHKRATIMGTQSFGKGSVQNVIPLEDGSGLVLTVALYYIPTPENPEQGRTIQGLGIMPDITVKPLEDVDVPMVREKDLMGHIVGQNEKVEEGASTSTTPTPKAGTPTKAKVDKLTPLEKEDYQLAKAIEFLKKQVGESSDAKAATAPKESTPKK